ncbi:MAG: hypothetical protein K0R46_2769 [Herbinix sp.]|nr:hypothetical protein [Herbinix sp.]
MDYKAIINLMKEMNQTDLTKLEIEEEGVRICLEKARGTSEEHCANTQVTFAPNSMPYPVYAPQMGYGQALPAAQGTPVTVGSTEAPAEDANHKKLVSPMVGTFYAQSSPDKPPFVKVGDKVKKGQTICIIEAMKLMNEIESEHDGEVVKILINNEDMVEFGQTMFLIK